MTTRSIPRWLLVFSGLVALLGLTVGGSLYLSPGAFIQDVDFAAPGARYLANMWAARQIAIASMIGLSALRRSPIMLQTSYGAYAIMQAQDVLIGISRADVGLIGGASVLGLASTALIWRLRSVAAR